MFRRLPDEAALSSMSLEELWRLFPIILSDSRPEWAEIYRKEKKVLESAVPGSCIGRLSHFGSTSVPGLAAKPTIDILLEVRPDSFVFEAFPLLQKCGYREMHRDEAQMRLVLVKGYTAEGFRGQAFHLHVRPCRDWDELYFRDYLAAHPEAAEQYAALKRSLKEKFEFNRDAYTEGKTELIAAMTRRAREEMPGRYIPGSAC
ncbi:GrpB family protein [uncultured Akkermansia sp.]|uniref:GrpB family protein n=1 Tax=uncultured Akkermansia sp. TaxID=512294 RepID=UPI00265D5E7B|nr:GrpB family protein [uncultured Akkermansia sp.]